MSGAVVALAFVALAACSHSETPTSGAGALPTASGDNGPTLSATSTPGSPNNPLPRAPSPTADVALAHPIQGPPYVWRSQDDNPDGTVNAAGTSGSGCTPPSGETLPDGVWAGLVADWRPDALVLDLVCAYGPATPLHATNFAQCTATSGNAEGCYIDRDLVSYTDDTPRTRTLPATPDAVFVGTDEDPVAVGDVSSLKYWSDRTGHLMWVYINDGVVTQVVEQYYP